MTEFQLSYFKSWEVMLWSAALLCEQIWKPQQWPWDWKMSVFIPVPKRGIAKEFQTTEQLHSSQVGKVMLKILQARLQQYMNHELPDVQFGFRKGRRTSDQIANIVSLKKQESSRKTSTLLSWHAKAFYFVSQQTVKNFERDGNPRPSHLLPEKSVGRWRSNS